MQIPRFLAFCLSHWSPAPGGRDEAIGRKFSFPFHLWRNLGGKLSRLTPLQFVLLTRVVFA